MGIWPLVSPLRRVRIYSLHQAYEEGNFSKRNALTGEYAQAIIAGTIFLFKHVRKWISRLESIESVFVSVKTKENPLCPPSTF